MGAGKGKSKRVQTRPGADAWARAHQQQHNHILVKSLRTGGMFVHKIYGLGPGLDEEFILDVFSPTLRPREALIYPDGPQRFATVVADAGTLMKTLNETLTDREATRSTNRHKSRWQGRVFTFDHSHSSNPSEPALACCHEDDVIYVGLVLRKPSAMDKDWKVQDITSFTVDEATEIAQIIEKMPELEQWLEKKLTPGVLRLDADELPKVVF